MKKTVLSTCLAFALTAPLALADDQTTSASGGKTPKTSAPSHSLLKAPFTVAGLVAATVVGTPVCFVRKLPREIKDGGLGLAGTFVNDSDTTGNASNKWIVVPSTVLWSPFATTVAFLQSPGLALGHAWNAKRPFSKEQFSFDWFEPEQKQPNQ
jgi:hypothetical protein